MTGEFQRGFLKAMLCKQKRAYSSYKNCEESEQRKNRGNKRNL